MPFKGRISTIVLIIYLTSCITISYVQSSTAGNPLVDHATLDYLSVENSLWTKLINSSNNDEKYLFALIRNDHKRFLGKSIFLGGNDLTDKNVYKLPSTRSFKELLSKIELLRSQVSSLLEPDNATLASFIHSFEHKVVEDLIDYSNDIIQEISRHDFWESGTNVSIFFDNYLILKLG